MSQTRYSLASPPVGGSTGSGADGSPYIFFVANVNVNSDGTLNVNVNRLENSNVWNAENRHRVVVPKPAVSPAPYRAGVFSRPLRQPPSIRPISSSTSENAMYLLVSIELISQESWTKNLSASSAVIACRSSIIFSGAGK